MFGLVAICCVVNVLLNLIIVPRYGYHGAAVTTFASYLLYPVMVYCVTRRYLAWVIPWRSVLGASRSRDRGGARGVVVQDRSHRDGVPVVSFSPSVSWPATAAYMGVLVAFVNSVRTS